MSLGKSLVTGQPDLINISLYYKYVETKYGTHRLSILLDDDGKKQMDDWGKKLDKKPDDECDIQIINTKWKMASWSEQNQIIASCQTINPATNQLEPDWTRYRDLRIKSLLVDWDLQHEKTKIPVTPEFIDRLPAEIVIGLFDRYERAISDSGDLGKQ